MAPPDTAFLSLFKLCRSLHSLAILCAFLQISRGAYRNVLIHVNGDPDLATFAARSGLLRGKQPQATLDHTPILTL